MNDYELSGYELSRNWFDFCFENPEKINPNHTAIYFFAIEHCNRLGWKEKFGMPTQMTMEAIGIKKHDTYIKYFKDLVDWGFLKLVQKSQNQYSANIVSLKSAIPKNGKALGKAMRQHGGKHSDSTGESNPESNPESNGSIDKPITYNLKPITAAEQKIFEMMRRAIYSEMQDKEVWLEVGRFLNKYPQSKDHVAGLVNKWCSNVEMPEPKKVYASKLPKESNVW